MSTQERIKAIADAIADAGFPEDRRNSVLERIACAPGSILEVHAALNSTESPIAESRKKLEKVAQTAEKLRALIDDLPHGTRAYLGFPPYKLAEPNPLAALIERAHSYHESVQRGSGRPKNENLRGLLFDLVSLWGDELPNVAGITRDGSGPDDGRALYKGPLFAFVLRLLDAEEIPYHSADSVGRELWQLWSQHRHMDERHAAGLCIRCEKELEDKARWLCDDCRGWPWPQATVQKPS